MAYSDLGQRVKQKYPGVYDDLNDDDLGQRISSKYPGIYDDIAGTGTTTPQRGGTLESVAGVIGVKNVGKGIAQTKATREVAKVTEDVSVQNSTTVKNLIKRISSERDATKKRKLRDVLSKFQRDTNTQPTVEELATNGEGYVKPRAVVGDAASLATLVGTLGLKGATTGARIAQGAGSGAAFGASDAVRDAESIGQAAKKVVLGAGVGAVGTGAIEGTTRITRSVAQKGAEAVYKKLVKTPLKQVTAGKEQLGPGLLKRNVTGDYGQMAQQVEDSVRKNVASQAEIITQNTSKQIDLSGATDKVKSLTKSKFSSQSRKAVQTVIDDFLDQSGGKGKLSLPEAQKLKQMIGDEIGSNAFLTSEDKATKAALKALYREVKSAIEREVPDIAPINKELEFARRALPELEKLDASPDFIARLTGISELITGTVGLAVNPVITAGVLAERGLRDAKVATKIAQALAKSSGKKFSPKVIQLLKSLGLSGVANSE